MHEVQVEIGGTGLANLDTASLLNIGDTLVAEIDRINLRFAGVLPGVLVFRHKDVSRDHTEYVRRMLASKTRRMANTHARTQTEAQPQMPHDIADLLAWILSERGHRNSPR